jgi:hypothetical protein
MADGLSEAEYLKCHEFLVMRGYRVLWVPFRIN